MTATIITCDGDERAEHAGDDDSDVILCSPVKKLCHEQAVEKQEQGLTDPATSQMGGGAEH